VSFDNNDEVEDAKHKSKLQDNVLQVAKRGHRHLRLRNDN
jgi:hypothetical protein